LFGRVLTDIRMRDGGVASGPTPGVSARAAFLIACILFFALFVFAPRAMLGDPDTLWHIHFGQLIIDTLSFPAVDQWSTTAAGEPWIAKEWLSQVLYAGAYRVAGYNGVVGLAASAIALAFGILTLAWLQRLPASLVIFCLGAAFCLSVQHFLARPHVLAYPLMALWLAGLARACDEQRGPSPWLLLVLVLWANMHGGFSLGLVLGAGFAAISVWEARDRRMPLVRAWGGFLLLAVLASGLTPYGYEPLLVTQRLMSFGTALSIIVEWRPLNLQADKPSLLVVLTWIWLMLTRGPSFSLPRILVVLFIVYLFVSAVRNGEILGFVLPFVIPPTGRGQQPPAVLRPVAPAVAVASAAFVLAVITSTVWRKDLAPFPKALPQDCLSFAREHGLVSDRMLNAYEFGGFLITQGMPTFIDGRAELFGPERILAFNDFQLVRDPDVSGYLNRFRIGWTLLNPELPVVQALDQLPGWERAFEGGSCTVHRRRASVSMRGSIEPGAQIGGGP
jgi:hypothetical protein